MTGHSDSITGVNFNRDGTLIASSSLDGSIVIWDVTNQNPLLTLKDQEIGVGGSPVSFVTFSPNSKYILSGSWDSKLKLWNAGNGKLLRSYAGHVMSSYCLFANFSTTHGKWIVCGSEDGLIYIWSLQTPMPVASFVAHSDVVIAVSCHPKLNMIASGGLENDHTVKIWLAAT